MRCPIFFLFAVLIAIPVAWGGEIIVSPKVQSGASAASEASVQKERARAYREEHSEHGPTIIFLPEEEDVEGLLSPDRNSADRALDNRVRARENRRDNGSGHEVTGTLPMPGSGSVEVESSQDQARENRLKAKEYSHGDRGYNSLKAGSDGLPIVICKDSDNIAGRIGDDDVSGNVITIFRDGKQIRVRCK